MAPINLPLGDASWRGLDARNKAQDIPDGFVQQSDNLYCDAGRWKIRPGLAGQWSSTVANPVYAMEPVTRGNGDTVLWFATGPESDEITGSPSTWTGQIRTYTPGTTSPSAVLPLPPLPNGATGLVAKSVVIRQIGGFVYVADGTSTGLLRFPIDGSAGEVAQGLNKPNAPVSTGLSHLPLIAAPGLATWETNDIDSSLLGNVIASAAREPDATNTTTAGTAYWKANGSGVAFQTGADIDGNTVSYAVIGGNGNYFENRGAIELPVSEGEYPQVFAVYYTGRTKPVPGAVTSRAQVSVLLYDNATGAGDPFETRSYYIGLMLDHPQRWGAYFDCRDLTTNIKSIRIRFECQNGGISGDDPMFSQIALYVSGGFAFPLPANDLQAYSGHVFASDQGGVCTGDEESLVVKLPQETKFFTRGKRVFTDFSSSDYSDVQRIVTKVRLAYPASDAVPVRLFIENAGGDRAYSPQTYLKPSIDQTVVFDVTTVDDTIRSVVTRFGLEFVGDIPYPATAKPPPIIPGYEGYQLLVISEITNPGNLTVNLTVRYRLVEWYSNGDATLLNVLQSNGSEFSPEITPTDTNAVAVVTFPAKVNTGTSDYFALYRFGDYDDGYGRLVCLLPWTQPDFDFEGDTEKPDGATYPAAPENEFIARTGNILYDNTPASWLLEKDTYQNGREQPPKFIREIVEWNNRLWLLADNEDSTRRRSELYGSWLLSTGTNAGLYFSRSVSDADPSAPVKGFYSHIGTENGDKALRLIAIQDRLAILMERASPFIISGTDPTNIEIHAFAGDSPFSLGLVARNAAILFDGAVCYLTPDGLIAWSPFAAAQKLSEQVRRIVTPRRAGLAPYGSTALKQAALWENGGCLYLSLPTESTDNAPNRVLRFDPNENSDAGGSWTVWTGISATGGVMLAGASVLPGSDAFSGHYVATQGGMIALFIPGFGNKTTSGASETAITFTLATRSYATERGFAALRPFRFDIEVSNGDSGNTLPLTLGVRAKTNFWEKVYTIAASATDSQPTTRVSGVRGDSCHASLSGSSKRGVEIGKLRVQASVGSERR